MITQIQKILISITALWQ